MKTHTFQSKNILFGIVFILIVYFVFLPSRLSAQSIPRVKISGRVIDISTGKPLYDANVFLANTTRGSATNKNGYFVIENVPVGTYRLVVSMIGYEVKTMEIRLRKTGDKRFNFKLKPKLLKGEKVTVFAEYPYKWRRLLKKFEEAFLGPTENASKCKILNPEVLDFTFDKASRKLTATASQPLQIENRALGYRMVFFMKKFIFIDAQQKGPSYIDYSGDLKFEYLIPKDEKKKEEWQKNRLKAYHGSMRHFFAALCAGRLKKEGFKVYKASECFSIYPTRVKIDTLLSPGESPYEKNFSFKKWLNVIYKKEMDEIKYRRRLLDLLKDKYWRNSSEDTKQRWIRQAKIGCSEQISWLTIDRGDFITIDTKGHIISNASGLYTRGYWSWEGIAEALPYDYMPEDSGAGSSL